MTENMMSRFTLSSFCLLALLSADPARAQEAPTAGTQALSVGLDVLSYRSYSGLVWPRMNLDVAYTRGLGRAGLGSSFLLRGGLRTTLPDGESLPLEAYLRLQAIARIGFWEPAVGPEVGLSGLTRMSRLPTRPYPDDFVSLSEEREGRFGPLYLAFTAAPLRLRLGRFLLSALELQLGTSVPSWGAATRLQLGLLHVGGVL